MGQASLFPMLFSWCLRKIQRGSFPIPTTQRGKPRPKQTKQHNQTHIFEGLTQLLDLFLSGIEGFGLLFLLPRVVKYANMLFLVTMAGLKIRAIHVNLLLQQLSCHTKHVHPQIKQGRPSSGYQRRVTAYSPTSHNNFPSTFSKQVALPFICMNTRQTSSYYFNSLSRPFIHLPPQRPWETPGFFPPRSLLLGCQAAS